MSRVDPREGVRITKERKKGNTERIVNNTIELLFAGEEVELIDETETRAGAYQLLERIKERLHFLKIPSNFYKIETYTGKEDYSTIKLN